MWSCDSHVLWAALHWSRSPTLVAAVHRAQAAWVGVVRDCNPSSIGPLLRSLLWSADHAPLRVSSLRTLVAVVGCIGPLVAPPLTSRVLQLPMSGLTPSLPAEEALLMLQLLMACVTSGNPWLHPPTGMAVQLLTDLCTHHGNREVMQNSRHYEPECYCMLQLFCTNFLKT